MTTPRKAITTKFLEDSVDTLSMAFGGGKDRPRYLLHVAIMAILDDYENLASKSKREGQKQ